MDTLKLNELYAQKKSVGGNKEGDIPDESENLLTK